MEATLAFTRLPAVTAAHKAPVVLIHGFASTPVHNWDKPGWVSKLRAEGFALHLVTLPFHRLPEAEKGLFVPHRVQPVSWVHGDALAQLAQEIGGYLKQLGEPVHLIGFSLGARLAWQLAATFPELVVSLTAGAMPTESNLQEVQAGLRGQAPVPENFAPVLEATPLAHENLKAFTVASFSDLDHTTLPGCPTLMFLGTEDTVATSAYRAYKLLPPGERSWLEVPGRDHISVLTSAKVRRAVLSFLIEAENNRT